MGKRLSLVFICALFFFISLISAQTYAENSIVDLKISCVDINCSQKVNITIEFPNTTIAVDNQEMTINNGYANYTFTRTSTFGDYNYFTNSTYANSFSINYRGDVISSGQGVLYLSLFAILFFFFYLTILAINQLPSSNTKDEEGRILSISYLKYLRPVGWMFTYFLMIGILFLASNLAFNYLNEQLFAQILFVLYRLAFLAAPIVITLWIVWIFVQMFHDKQMQNLLNRGFFPQGKL